MDKRDPSLGDSHPGTDMPAGAAPRAPQAPAQAAPPHAPRPKGPPADPEEFERWLGIEQLKVNMRRLEVESRRLELETRRANEATSPSSAPHAAERPTERPSEPATASSRANLSRLMTIVLALLALLLGVLAGISAQQTAAQRTEVAALREEIGALRGALASVENRLADLASAPAAAPTPPTAPEPVAPPAPAPATNGAATQPLIGTPADGQAQTSPGPDMPGSVPAAVPGALPADTAVAPEPPARPALMGEGYTVRLFAPVKNLPAARVDAITNILKAAGFEVVVSDTGIAAPTSNTLSYHAASTEEANKLATLIQSKRPSLDIELRASPSIPAAARQVLILNLTEDALR